MVLCGLQPEFGNTMSTASPSPAVPCHWKPTKKCDAQRISPASCSPVSDKPNIVFYQDRGFWRAAP
jgi:hypothetical protein